MSPVNRKKNSSRLSAPSSAQRVLVRHATEDGGWSRAESCYTLLLDYFGKVQYVASKPQDKSCGTLFLLPQLDTPLNQESA
jgi:hypothetical protein